MKKTNNKGFSLVELIIVIAIMAILAGAIAPALIKYIDKSRKSNDVNACDTIKTAVSTAMANENVYEYITQGTKLTSGVTVTNPGASGFTAAGDITAIITVTPPTSGNTGSVAITCNATDNNGVKSQAEALIKDNIGETTPKIKYKKAADGSNTPDGYIVYVSEKGTIYVGLGTLASTTMNYEIIPEVCNQY